MTNQLIFPFIFLFLTLSKSHQLHSLKQLIFDECSSICYRFLLSRKLSYLFISIFRLIVYLIIHESRKLSYLFISIFRSIVYLIIHECIFFNCLLFFILFQNQERQLKDKIGKCLDKLFSSITHCNGHYQKFKTK